MVIIDHISNDSYKITITPVERIPLIKLI